MVCERQRKPRLSLSGAPAAYPPADFDPRLWLVPHSWPASKTRLYQLVFLMAMFDVAAEYVRALSPGKVYEDEAALAVDWREFLDRDDARARDDFYYRVGKVGH